MKIVKPITQADMIASFLQAELVGSTRFVHSSEKALEMLNLNSKLISNPDLTNELDNQNRAKLLGLTRGWPDKYLFSGFPENVKWCEVEISHHELRSILRLKSSPNLPKAQRPVSWVAEQISQGKEVEKYDNKVVLSIKASIATGEKIEPIIAVAEKIDSKTVLLEGHSRAAAYSLADTEKITIILGISQQIHSWHYF